MNELERRLRILRIAAQADFPSGSVCSHLGAPFLGPVEFEGVRLNPGIVAATSAVVTVTIYGGHLDEFPAELFDKLDALVVQVFGEKWFARWNGNARSHGVSYTFPLGIRSFRAAVERYHSWGSKVLDLVGGRGNADPELVAGFDLFRATWTIAVEAAELAVDQGEP